MSPHGAAGTNGMALSWRPDDTLRVFDLARRLCRQASGECEKEKVAAAIGSAKTVAAVERLAKADRKHAATIEQWDADPWLLNTPGGVVDLRTGIMRPAPARRLYDKDHGGITWWRMPRFGLMCSER